MAAYFVNWVVVDVHAAFVGRVLQVYFFVDFCAVAVEIIGNVAIFYGVK